MICCVNYYSPLGKILMASSEKGLIGLWFENQKYYAYNLGNDYEIKSNFHLDKSKRWLDIYFSGQQPNYTPSLDLNGSLFRLDVWNYLLTIPYGETSTYGEIARKIAKKRGLNTMSAQAIGFAVGHNPVSIIVPCHRVLGVNGNLIGYAGGVDKKQYLLNLEQSSL